MRIHPGSGTGIHPGSAGFIENSSSKCPPAVFRWCNTNRVQVSTGMLTEGTNLQNTSLEPSLPFLEHYEGQTPAHSLVGAQHTLTHCQHTRKHLHAHTQQSVCSHPSACVSTQLPPKCACRPCTHTCMRQCAIIPSDTPAAF